MQSVLNMQRAQSGRGVMNAVHHDCVFGDCYAVAIYRAGSGAYAAGVHCVQSANAAAEQMKETD